METLRRHHISFRHAFDGIKWAFTTQPNFRVHTLLSIIALILSFLLKITYPEIVLIVLTIVFGLGIEMVNTAIEEVTDMITTKYTPQAKIAKDVSAGMMLLTAFGACLVGILIFVPRIISLIIQ